MKQQTRIGFFVIVGLALVTVVAILAFERLGVYRLPTRGGITTTVRILAAPAAQPWLETVANEYNQSNLQIKIEVMTAARGNDALRQFSQSSINLPDIWIVESELVGDLGSANFQKFDTLAQDQLLWVAATTRGKALPVLDWESISTQANQDLQFRLALPTPNSAESIATCLSAAASFYQSAEIANLNLGDRTFRDWFAQILLAVPNRAKTPFDLLSSRPAGADVGLVLGSQTGLLPSGAQSHLPNYAVLLNYSSYSRIAWPELSASEANGQRQATQQVLSYLQNRAGDLQQQLNPALQTIQSQIEPTSAMVRQLDWCWKQ
jgi:hypothetical protein